MTTNVLFICPHSAGKSLAAATYFRASTARRNMAVSIAVAGPEPDEVNMPNVADALAKQGFAVDWHPRRIAAADTSQADLLISIGCDHDSIPTDKAIIEWDVPLISRDLFGSLQAIHERCEALAAQLHDRP